MNVRSNVPAPKPIKRISDTFKRMRHGDSMHVGKTEYERVKVMSSFIAWAKRKNSTMTATSRKVDATDPDGAGYRVWFLNEEG